MPKLGLTMSEGTVSKWLVAAGQSVAAGQTIFVVETDKISHEIEAAEAGEIGGVLVAAERLTRSKTEIPHCYVATPVDIGLLERLCKELNTDSARIKISVPHFLVAAVGRTMSARRHLNAVWREGTQLMLDDVAVGVAVDTDNGARMPVIAGAHHRPLDDLAASINDAAERARSGRLCATDMAQAAISLSNVGMFGVTSLVPIIDPDQSFIIGVGAAQNVFRPDDDGAPVARRDITLTLAADHRLLDGAAGAGLLRAVADQIEAPLQLLRAAVTP
jgi:pyruvate dehydrogenase E2 component (dihydrolipoamide acetyltransferase)